MYGGETVEESPVRELFKSPKHPYTVGLLSCVPTPPTESGATIQLSSIPGVVFPAAEPAPSACLFMSRCPHGPKSHVVARRRRLWTQGPGTSLGVCIRVMLTGETWGEQQINVEIGRAQAKPVLTARSLRRFLRELGTQVPTIWAPSPAACPRRQ